MAHPIEFFKWEGKTAKLHQAHCGTRGQWKIIENRLVEKRQDLSYFLEQKLLLVINSIKGELDILLFLQDL